jgi:hypothetical protein
MLWKHIVGRRADPQHNFINSRLIQASSAYINDPNHRWIILPGVPKGYSLPYRDSNIKTGRKKVRLQCQERAVTFKSQTLSALHWQQRTRPCQQAALGTLARETRRLMQTRTQRARCSDIASTAKYGNYRSRRRHAGTPLTTWEMDLSPPTVVQQCKSKREGSPERRQNQTGTSKVVHPTKLMKVAKKIRHWVYR